MTAPVRFRYPIPQSGQALVGKVVRSPTLSDLALASNWAQGRGAQLVPACSAGSVTLGASTTHRFGFYTRPTFPAFARLWTIHAASQATISVSVNGDTATAHGLHRYGREGAVVERLEFLGAQSESAGSEYVEVTTGATYSATIHSIGCVEIPRSELAPTSATERAIDMSTVARGAPIYADSAPSGTDYGLYLLADALDDQADSGRRVGHFAWSVPYLVGGSPTTGFARATTAASGSPDSLLLLPPVVNARPGPIVVTTGAAAASVKLRCAVLAWQSGSTTGTVRFASAQAADTQTAAVSATTPTWVHTGTDLLVQTEDQSVADGRRGSNWETVAIDFWRASGSGTVYVAAIVIYET